MATMRSDPKFPGPRHAVLTITDDDGNTLRTVKLRNLRGLVDIDGDPIVDDRESGWDVTLTIRGELGGIQPPIEGGVAL